MNGLPVGTKYWDEKLNMMSDLSPEQARGVSVSFLESESAKSNSDTDVWAEFFKHVKREYEQPKVKYIDISTPSLTQNAVQINWKVPSEFPCCPQSNFENPLQAYKQNLKRGAIFCKNKYYYSTVVDTAFDKNGILLVMTNNPDGIKRWALAKIAYEFGKFVHISEGTFFEKEKLF